MIFTRRGEKGADPFLERKVQLFLAGGVLALAGVGLDSPLLVGLAIIILVFGMALRFIPRKGPSCDSGVPEGEETDVDEDSEGS